MQEVAFVAATATSAAVPVVARLLPQRPVAAAAFAANPYLLQRLTVAAVRRLRSTYQQNEFALLAVLQFVVAALLLRLLERGGGRGNLVSEIEVLRESVQTAAHIATAQDTLALRLKQQHL